MPVKSGYFLNNIYKMIEEKYITVKEYAERNGLNLKTVYNHINTEKIPKERIKKVLNTTLIRL